MTDVVAALWVIVFFGIACLLVAGFARGVAWVLRRRDESQ